ncbi:MAG: hypothetical protein ACTS73_08215 [Arsenophonus sp. NEOnobi-MAG3]
MRDIIELLGKGKIFLVQVVKVPPRTKWARLTTDITLAYRYLLFMS